MTNSLNLKQRAIFNVAADLAKDKVKYSNCVRPKIVNLLNLFITGGAGIGQSMLIKTCGAYLTKTFNAHSCLSDKVVLFAPTGISAIILSAATIIPINFWTFATNLWSK